MEKTPVFAGLIIFVTSLVAYVTLSVLRLDTSGLLVFVAAAAGLGGFASWRNTETIKKQTNGPLTRLMTQFDDVVEKVDGVVERVGRLEEIERVTTQVSSQLDTVVEQTANTNHG